MTIVVEYEDIEVLRGWDLGLENISELCVMCQQPTRLWHISSNTPCCEMCAANITEVEVLAVKQKSMEFKNAGK